MTKTLISVDLNDFGVTALQTVPSHNWKYWTFMSNMTFWVSDRRSVRNYLRHTGQDN